MANATLALTLAFVLILAAIWLFWNTQLVREGTGVPRGQILYSDSDELFEPEPMYAHDIGLVGKPDYLVRVGDGSLIPVELKSGAAPEHPYESHLLQLGAYCLLVEENYGIRPNVGVIRYKDKDFEIEYDDDFEATVIDTVSAMRADLYARDVQRSHRNPALCKACGVSEFCDQKLTRGSQG